MLCFQSVLMIKAHVLSLYQISAFELVTWGHTLNMPFEKKEMSLIFRSSSYLKWRVLTYMSTNFKAVAHENSNEFDRVSGFGSHKRN